MTSTAKRRLILVESTLRRRRHQRAGSLQAAVKTSVNAYVIHPADCRYGHVRGNFGKQEFTQVAIAALFPRGPLPTLVNSSKLRKMVNDYLSRDPDFCARFGRGVTVSRQTVARALKVLHEANR
jgi:hypothetical protein